MAKQRPTLGTFAQPVSTLVTPVNAEKTVTPLDERAIRDTYAFAESFGELSQSMVKVASTIKNDLNAENFQEGVRKVNESRSTYKTLVETGQIQPNENPWLTVGAQKASGVLEASKAEIELREKYNQDVANNPDLLKDSNYFDTLVSSFVQNKTQQIGGAPYLSDSFYENFNPSMIKLAAENSTNVGKYKTQKIIDSIQVQVNEVLKGIASKSTEPRPVGGGVKDEGFLGVMFDPQGNSVTEKSVTFDTGTANEISMPMLVPGLSLEGQEAIVSNNASYADLSAKDREVIYKHAKKRIAENKSPFYGPEDRLQENLLPALQTYMDEQGKNMGYPRIANLAVAGFLIEAMKSGSQTYDAEVILNSLKAGTGRLSDTAEVKTMLATAEADIGKNRFSIELGRQKDLIGRFITQASGAIENEAFNKTSTNVAGQYEDAWNTDIAPQLRNMDSMQRAEAYDKFQSAVVSSRRRGETKVSDAEVRSVEKVLAEDINKSFQAGILLDWNALNNRSTELVNLTGNTLDSEQGKQLRKASQRVVNNALEKTKDFLIGQLNTKMGRNSIASFEAEPGDTPEITKAKSESKMLFRLNELQASIHFDLNERLVPYRGIAVSGISVDVEKGVRPELVDLIYMYNNSAGGRSDVSKLLGTGDAGQRTLRFLQMTHNNMGSGMALADAVRDSAQALNMDTAKSSLALLNVSPNGPQMQEFETAREAAGRQFHDSWFPFGFFDYQFNSDSSLALKTMFDRGFIAEMNRSGSFATALEAGATAVSEDLMIAGPNLRGGKSGVLPRKPLSDAGVSPDYIQAFTNVMFESSRGKGGIPVNGDINMPLVWVGDGADGAPLFAFRDPEGRAVMDRYFTVTDLVARQRGPNSEAPMRERVIKELDRKLQERERGEQPGFNPYIHSGFR